MFQHVFHFKFRVLILLWLGWTNAHAQIQRYTVSGFVRDAATGEMLVGASLWLPEIQSGTSTNAYGFYSMTLPRGTYALQVSYVGFQTRSLRLDVDSNRKFNFEMDPLKDLQEIEVVDDRISRQAREVQMSKIELTPQQIQQIPMLFGEKDLLKTFQLMPGVQKGNEGSSGIYVRGGGPDQNLILLDEATVYNASHLFGFFSVFNGNAIKNASLTKGGFPARYGGRLSSVLDISMKDGNNRDWCTEGSIGNISANVTVEGPLIKNKASMLVSGRRTYLDLLTAPLLLSSADGLVGYFFQDFNAKFNYQLDDRNRLYLSGYLGQDKLYATTFGSNPLERTTASLGWGNKTGTLRWNHQANSRTFINSSLILSDYTFLIQLKSNEGLETFDLKYNSTIRDVGVKVDLDWLPVPEHKIKAGFQSTRHTFIPTAFVLKNSMAPDFNFDRVAREYSLESGLYVEDEWSLGDRWLLHPGLRVSTFAAGTKTYARPEPRLAARYLLGNNQSIKVAYTEMNQYLHLLSNSGTGLPTDLWVPANEKVGPQFSRQAALGYSLDKPRRSLSFSTEAYYKTTQGNIAYRPGASFLLIDPDELFNENGIPKVQWEEQVVSGSMVSYGLEILLQKHHGLWNGWLGYTWSKTDLRFEELNGGLPFPARYDRRHDLSWVNFFDIRPPKPGRKGIKGSAVFVYGTGNAVTLPQGTFNAPILGIPGFENNNNIFFGPGWNSTDYGAQNNYRLRSYQRVDLSLQFTRRTRCGERVTELSAYNLLSRANPWFIQVESDGFSGRNRLVQYSLFAFVIPSISWRFKFCQCS